MCNFFLFLFINMGIIASGFVLPPWVWVKITIYIYMHTTEWQKSPKLVQYNVYSELMCHFGIHHCLLSISYFKQTGTIVACRVV